MKTCPRCGGLSEEGAAICDLCGQVLELDTKDTQITELAGTPLDVVRSGYGSSDFDRQTEVILFLKDRTGPLLIFPGKRFVIGRRGNPGEAPPDLDLDPYGAAAKGVSRRHAILSRDDIAGRLTISDLKSRNGTYVNEARLLPDLPHTIHDGDMIRLGQMIMYIYFKRT